MKQIVEEWRTYRAVPVSHQDLDAAGLTPLGVPAAEYRLAFGAQFDESGDHGEFWTIERQEGDRWVDAVPHFESHYVAAYKGRIVRAQHDMALAQFIETRVPQFRAYLAEDLAVIEKALDDFENL